MRISAVVSGNQDVKPHPTETKCFTQTVDTPSGERLFHISTFGSTARASAPKSSQSMQFDADTAAALISAMVSTFGSSVLPPLNPLQPAGSSRSAP